MRQVIALTKSDLIKDMKATTGSSFITRSELARYLGYACPKAVDKYLYPLERIEKRYFIADVAAAILAQGGYRDA